MSGDRLEGASITIWPIDGANDGGGRQTRTTRNGHFHLALEPGKYRALVSADQFDPMSATFTVEKSQIKI